MSLLGLGIALVALVLTSSTSTEARLKPYYVVTTTTHNVPKPRILFALDTSGSMGRRADATNVRCLWSECEEPAYHGTVNESRMSSARRAINSVMTATAGNAKFSVMTFDQHDPPSAIPIMCDDEGVQVRFAHIDTYETDPILRNWDTGLTAYYAGAYRVCGTENRPFVYLRWDELGVGSVIPGNNESGVVPPSPLISHDQTDFEAQSNKLRRAQWFPEYLGTRVQLNATTDPGQVLTLQTVGDYDPVTEVWGHDFYYWPYVDGFPGYGTWDTTDTYDDNNDKSGVASITGIAQAKLWAPFYLDLSGTAIPPAQWGPADEAEALADITIGMSPLIQGGIDAVGSTPWLSTVGTLPAGAPSTNEAGGHSTIASYLEFVTTTATPDECAPTSLVLVTDGDPSAGEGGDPLYAALADIRKLLHVKTYVVGFFLGSTELNHMACAAAGACDGTCTDPCNDNPTDNWDTCRDDQNETTDCAYLASSTSQLETVLLDIIGEVVDVDVSSGPGASANEFGVGADGALGEGEVVQTKIFSYTEYPEWRGHVTRDYCTDEQSPGVLEDFCVEPIPEFSIAESEPTFGPVACPQSREWDAGYCLQQTLWNDRRIYSYDANNDVYRIAEPDGTASATFLAELTTLSLIPGVSPQAEADAIASFILGENAPDNWKLPGLSNSAPVIVGRIPKFEAQRAPEVNVNDPHCGGRRFSDVDLGEIPQTLRDFAFDVWDADATVDTDWYLNLPADHYAYQEAVMVGDDMGVMHAFQFNSGNELFGLLPRPLLANAVESASYGAASMGQPSEIDDHVYGLSATLNQGWVYDDVALEWRHLVVFGFGIGGKEFVTLDVKHMSPSYPVLSGGQLEVVWTTEDPLIKAQYDLLLGETWARPALAYHLEPDELTSTPSSFLVFGSGYADETPTGPVQGRSLVTANALTGAVIDDVALPTPLEPVYEPSFAAIVDPAVATHCMSRYWAEAQEMYVADPAGQLFRWDLGRDTTPLTFHHDADSAPGTDTSWAATAERLAFFPACQGTGATCTVVSTNEGDPFTFPVAVSANERITDLTTAANPIVETDEFLLAMISGSPIDDTTDWGQTGNDFHSSIYLLVDDHSAPLDAHDGLGVPAGAPKTAGAIAAGTSFLTDSDYVRIAVSDIQRQRSVIPFTGAADAGGPARNFGRATRPIRAPRIVVTGAASDQTDPVTIVEGVEVYFVTFTVYEPGDELCDPGFYDSANNIWYYDYGSTYEITFRLTVEDTAGFDFSTGAAGGPADFGAGFETGLTLESVTQLDDPDLCPGGVCGPQPGAPSNRPCDTNEPISSLEHSRFAIPLASRHLNAFTPVE